MKRLEGLLITLPVLVLALIVAGALIATAGGCQTVTKNPDGSTTTTMDVNATMATLNGLIQLAEQAYTFWEQTHPQATPEERAAARGAKEAEKQRYLDLIQQLLSKQPGGGAGAVTAPKGNAKSIVLDELEWQTVHRRFPPTTFYYRSP